MRFTFSILVALLFSGVLSAQKSKIMIEVPETFKDVVQIDRNSVPMEYVLYNRICDFIGTDDKIDFDLHNPNAQFSFRGKGLPKFNRGGLKSPYLVISKGNMASQLASFTAKILSPGSSTKTVFDIKIPNQANETWKHDEWTALSQYETTNSGLLTGKYTDYYSNGQIKETGNYCIIDAMISDTITVVDPETYQMKVEIVKSDKDYIKCGKWKKYDVNGTLTEKRKFRKPKK